LESTGAEFTWISSPGEKVSASNIRIFTLGPRLGPRSIQAMAKPAKNSTIPGHSRVGFTSVGALTRNWFPLAPPRVESGTALMKVALWSPNAATNCILRKPVIAGAFADAPIEISAMAFPPSSIERQVSLSSQIRNSVRLYA
jgi:hypothetical protein